MSTAVRRGGRRILDGLATTWSVADGSRGRRWRTVRKGPDGRVVSCALETSPDGTFSKIEAASDDSLLTLHVEDDRTLHGHVVTPGGVRHLALGPLDPALVLVKDDAFTAAAVTRSLALAGRVGVGEEGSFRAVRIDRGLDVEVVTLAVRRPTQRFWELTADGRDGVMNVRVELGPGDLPAGTPDDREWPLEA